MLSTTAANGMLNATYGAGKASGVPSSHVWVPLDASGNEVVDESSASVRVTIPNNGTSWPGAADGATSVTVSHADATGAWSAPVAAWELRDGSGNVWADGRFAEERVIDGSGVIAPFIVTVYFNLGV